MDWSSCDDVALYIEPLELMEFHIQAIDNSKVWGKCKFGVMVSSKEFRVWKHSSTGKALGYARKQNKVMIRTESQGCKVNPNQKC